MSGPHRCARCDYVSLGGGDGLVSALVALQTAIGGTDRHVTSAALAAALGRPLATVTNQLAALERLGLVTRQQVSHGRGGKRMLTRLTFAGRSWRPLP